MIGVQARPKMAMPRARDAGIVNQITNFYRRLEHANGDNMKDQRDDDDLLPM
jgi:hypothetical protein